MTLFGTSPWLVRLSLIGVLVLSAGEARATGFDRVLDSVLKEAQTSLEKNTQLWVDRSLWENAWEVRTDHYLIRMAGDRARVQAYGRLLEIMYLWYYDFLGVEPTLSEPMNVYIFPSLEAYNQFSTGTNAGSESSIYGGYWNVTDPKSPAVAYDFPHDLLVRRWLIHASAHQYMGRAFGGSYGSLEPRNLSWVSYGLAAYFETKQDREGAIRAFRNLLSNGNYVSIRDVLRSKIGDLNQARLDELALFFDYLINIREDTRTVKDESGVVQSAPFRDYVLRLLNQADVSDDPVAKMLSTRLFSEELAAVEADFKAHSF